MKLNSEQEIILNDAKFKVKKDSDGKVNFRDIDLRHSVW